MLQVAQPALAVGWAFVLLDEEIRPVQLLGMGLVLLGLALFTWSSQRRVRAS
jgi:drug/metabolite transporter (DMT)-like permease